MAAEYYGQLLARKAREHGSKWDPSGLAPQFAPYLHSDTRIKVRGPWGTRTGTVGITTGWRPAFLLMARTSAHGSSDLLGPEDQIIAVKRGRVYVPVAGVAE